MPRGSYESYKLQPPLARNLPPVAGAIVRADARATPVARARGLVRGRGPSRAQMWSRQLLQRVISPMKKFEAHAKVYRPAVLRVGGGCGGGGRHTCPQVMGARDSRKIIRMYNKVARTLVAFEYMWCARARR